MRRSPFVFTMLLLLPSIVQAQEKAAEPKPPPRESLRYDGKPFEYWQTYWQTELKAERRVECLRAMGAFGSNGYGAEAAEVVVRIVRSYPEPAFGFPFKERDGPFKLTPDERVLYEAFLALEKLGSSGVPALLFSIGSPNIRALIHQLLANSDAAAIPVDVVPAVVRMANSQNEKERDLALYVLYSQTSDNEKLGKALAKELTKPDTERKLFKAVFRNMRSYSHYFTMPEEEDFFAKLAGQSPNSIPTLIAELRGLKKARQEDAEDAKRKFSPRPGSPFPPPFPPMEPETWETHLPIFESRPRSSSVVIVTALGKTGPAARDALPELREALGDPCVELQNAARTAIEQITKK